MVNKLGIILAKKILICLFPDNNDLSKLSKTGVDCLYNACCVSQINLILQTAPIIMEMTHTMSFNFDNICLKCFLIVCSFGIITQMWERMWLDWLCHISLQDTELHRQYEYLKVCDCITKQLRADCHKLSALFINSTCP